MSGSLKNAFPSQRFVAFGLGLLGTLWLVAGCATQGGHLRDQAALPVATLETQRGLDPAEPYWPCQLANAHLAAGQRGAAQAYLDTALSLDASYAPAAVLLSRIQYDDGRYAEAAAQLQQLLDHTEDAPEAVRIALALNLQALGRSEQAAAALATCQGSDGTLATARVFTELQGPDYLDSLADAEAAVSRHPDSAADQNNYGISLLYAGRPQEARQAFRNALQIEPEQPSALYNLAIVESFYFFDEAEGREYFQRYQTSSRDGFDPDDLASTLGGETLAASQASLSVPEVGDAR